MSLAPKRVPRESAAAGSRQTTAAVPTPAETWGELRSDTVRLLDELGVRRVSIRNPIGPEYPIGNKLTCLGLPTEKSVRVFLDSDILLVRDVRQLSPGRAAGVRPADLDTAKVAGIPWDAAYGHFGIRPPTEQVVTTVDRCSIRPYYDAGLVAAPTRSELGSLWIETSREIRAHFDVKGPFLDQVALPVAIARAGLDVKLLGSEDDSPAHLVPLPLRSGPRLVHYHCPEIIRREKALDDELRACLNEQPVPRTLVGDDPAWRRLLQPLHAPHFALNETRRLAKQQLRRAYGPLAGVARGDATACRQGESGGHRGRLGPAGGGAADEVFVHRPRPEGIKDLQGRVRGFRRADNLGEPKTRASLRALELEGTPPSLHYGSGSRSRSAVSARPGRHGRGRCEHGALSVCPTWRSSMAASGNASGKLARFRKRRRKLVRRHGKRIVRRLNVFFASQSTIPSLPLYDTRTFPWVETLESHFESIRRELDGILEHRDALPHLQEIQREQSRIAREDHWKTFVLYGWGYRSRLACELCPETARAVSAIPGCKTALFSILAPGTVIPEHRGLDTGFLRVHFALKVPKRREHCVLEIDGRPILWEEGKTLVFDDCYLHSVRNDTEEERAVLLMHVERPMSWLGRMVHRIELFGLRRTALVADMLRNHAAWEQRFRQRLKLRPSSPEG